MPPCSVLTVFRFFWSPETLNRQTRVPPPHLLLVYMAELLGVANAACADFARVLIPATSQPSSPMHLIRMLVAIYKKNYAFHQISFDAMRTTLQNLENFQAVVGVIFTANESKRPVIYFRHRGQLHVWDPNPTQRLRGPPTLVCSLESECEYAADDRFFLLYKSERDLTAGEIASLGLSSDNDIRAATIAAGIHDRAMPRLPPTSTEYHLSVLRDCNTAARFDAWKESGGTLLGLKNLGCGINALTFLGVLSREEGERLVPLVNSRGTTLMEMMSFVYRGARVPQFERYFPIRTLEEVSTFLATLNRLLKNNECTIAKLMRFPESTPIGAEPRCVIDGRSMQLTPGHSIVFSKDESGSLLWLDPHIEIPPKPSVDASKALKSWSRQCYVAVGLLFNSSGTQRQNQAPTAVPIDVRIISQDDLPDHGPYAYNYPDIEMEMLRDE